MLKLQEPKCWVSVLELLQPEEAGKPVLLRLNPDRPGLRNPSLPHETPCEFFSEPGFETALDIWGICTVQLPCAIAYE